MISMSWYSSVEREFNYLCKELNGEIIDINRDESELYSVCDVDLNIMNMSIENYKSFIKIDIEGRDSKNNLKEYTGIIDYPNEFVLDVSGVDFSNLEFFIGKKSSNGSREIKSRIYSNGTDIVGIDEIELSCYDDPTGKICIMKMR